jgi:hypothetical protein
LGIAGSTSSALGVDDIKTIQMHHPKILTSSGLPTPMNRYSYSAYQLRPMLLPGRRLQVKPQSAKTRVAWIVLISPSGFGEGHWVCDISSAQNDGNYTIGNVSIKDIFEHYEIPT